MNDIVEALLLRACAVRGSILSCRWFLIGFPYRLGECTSTQEFGFGFAARVARARPIGNTECYRGEKKLMAA